MTKDERRIWHLWRRRVVALEADIAHYGKSSDPEDIAHVGRCWVELIREAEEITE